MRSNTTNVFNRSIVQLKQRQVLLVIHVDKRDANLFGLSGPGCRHVQLDWFCSVIAFEGMST